MYKNDNLYEGRNKNPVTIVVYFREIWVSLGWTLPFRLITGHRGSCAPDFKDMYFQKDPYQ